MCPLYLDIDWFVRWNYPQLPPGTAPLPDPTDTSWISIRPDRGAGSPVYTCWRLCALRNHTLVPFPDFWCVRWKKKGGNLGFFVWEPLDFRRRYQSVISRFQYSATCINARSRTPNRLNQYFWCVRWTRKGEPPLPGPTDKSAISKYNGHMQIF